MKNGKRNPAMAGQTGIFQQPAKLPKNGEYYAHNN
jgi:hypothetical protein